MADESALASPVARRALLAGGGSGGHVFPALAVGDELARRGWSVALAGSPAGMEARLAAERGLPFVALAARPLLGKSPWAKLVALVTLALSAFAARRVIRDGAFDLVVGTGGYASAPAVLGGRFARRPTILIEPNAEAGLANRWASRFADAAAVAYEATATRLKCLSWVTGVPVRAAFFDIAPLRTDGKPRLLVLGGSQGSLRINRLMAEVLTPLFERSPELSVLHQCGESHLEATLAAYRAAGLDTPRLRVVSFVDNMPAAMAAVDLVVSRAGAITLAEICAAGRPAVLLPLVAAAAHQLANAQLLADADAATLIEDVALDADRLQLELATLLGDRPRLARMGENARRLAHPQAAVAIVDRIEALLPPLGRAA
ncbi:MAG: undecaprenyldiphospho-muramoylpentapeptide beta-N-acetylglucosaminyltransferase [Thermoanaerobaculia bacterium]|jgi:UDP-N-acetylglucosamine--N-acetylmuramyl-(pentapeptide) pyrophosphoryl-undecaprenol N-acetylglucosamine transferase|nr:undecaprenyldiphospho-muramoylpentapeptide beta-N-acetylglucosaminyltransferase [Thermoanaerobaculia bacterium]